jgi:branched-chain amino acid transport system ATP-binding protein
MSLLAVQGLVAGYAGARIVDGLDLDIMPGEVVALLGRNGAGKSTAVSAITGTLTSMAGTVLIEDVNVTKAQPSRRFQLGMRAVRQDQPILRDLTVAENLRLVETSKEAAAESFPFLAERSSQRAGTLSGGEQKMLAVARSAANPGKLWILDEPSEGLQPMNVDRCAQLIREAAARGVGVLLVEQHIGMALAVADRWLVMETGAVIDQGKVTAKTFETVSRRLAV